MVWLAVTSALACGCAVSRKTALPPAAIRPSLEASKAELLAKYNRLAGSVRSLNAGVEWHPVAGSSYTGVIEEYREVRGFVLAQRPANIRMIGQAPVVARNIFDMVSDGQTFRVFIPPRNKFLVGDAKLEKASKKPIENLRPQHVLEAIFWTEMGEGRTVLFEESEEASGRFYVLTLLREGGEPEVERKVWFDRSDLSLCRIQEYAAKGALVSDIHLADWQPVAGPAAEGGAGLSYPRTIRLGRPREDYRLEMRITKLTLNEEISAERFRLEQPPGTELVRVGEEAREDRP